MRLIRILRDRLVAVIRRDRVAGDIRDELHFHLDMRIAENIRRGMPAAEARRDAIKRVGNIALLQDRGYDVRGGGFMETLLQDVRYGVRLLVKQRGFSAIAILTLALGIGATSALFSVIDAALIRPLPYPSPEQLVTIHLTAASDSARRGMPSVADMAHWRSLTHIFSHLATFRSETAVVMDGSQPEQITVSRVSADYFNMFGVAPAEGRLITPADEPLNAPPVAILGHAYWQQRFGGDASVVGKQLRFADESATIVGVAPPWFYPRTLVFRPLQLSEAQRAARQWRAFARLRPGVTFEAAERDVSALTRTMATGQADKSVTGAALMSMYEFTTTSSRGTLRILLAAVGFVLVLACVNVAGLQLARGSARHHELAVRASIGAGRSRLARQLLTESVVLSIAGAALGLVLAWLILDALVANIPVFLPSNAPIHIDWRVLGFTALLSIAAGVTFGLVPALRLSRVQVSAALSQAPRGVGSTLSRRTSGLLILAEVALAVVLLVGGGLMLRSFARLNAVNLGFDPESFVTLEAAPIDPSHTAYVNYYIALVERIRAMPGIAAVGAVGNVPLSGSYSGGLVTVDGNSDGQKFGAVFQWILPGYIEALGLPLHAGRTFSNVELQQRLPLVVISEDAARKMFGSASPLGHHIVISKVPHEVIGIVGNVRDLVLEDSPMGRGTPELYLPYGLASTTTTSAGRVQGRRMTVVVRPDRPLPGLVDQLKQTAHDVGQPAVVRRIRTGNEWFSASVTTPRQRTVLLSLLGALGLVLASVGVFGMTAYSVTLRTQEIGVRMAFGARPRDVVRTMVRDSAIPLALGIVVGIGGAALATRIIASFLFNTGPRDPLTFAAVAVVLAVCGLFAAWIPARRAARVDPVKALGTG